MAGNIAQVEFDEEKHEYTYRGRSLKGITGAIGAYLGKNYPRGNATVEVAASYGSQVHKEVERYFMEGVKPTTDSARYVTGVLEEHMQRYGGQKVACEVRVSDFAGTASNVDVVMYMADGSVRLYDIKTGVFDRTYCTLQLNAYDIMWHECYGQEVSAMQVICTKTRRVFDITRGRQDLAIKLLAWNKE